MLIDGLSKLDKGVMIVSVHIGGDSVQIGGDSVQIGGDSVQSFLKTEQLKYPDNP